MIRRLLGLAILAGLLFVPTGALAEEDPFADDTDPFEDSEDPFAEYEQQAANTSEATETLASEDEEDDDQDQQPADDNSSTQTDDTNDAPGLGLAGLAATGLAAALVTGKRRDR